MFLILLNYKSADEIKELLSQSQDITNMYVEHYIESKQYMGNLKAYKVDIYIKDNINIYDVLGRKDYVNYNTNEGFVIERCQKTGEFDVNTVDKVNDYSIYFNPEFYTYSYMFSAYVDNTWCDKVLFKNKDGFKSILYIDKNNGLVMKKISYTQNNKVTENFKYQINKVTDEQIETLSYYSN